jgi:SM-20-related protein
MNSVYESVANGLAGPGYAIVNDFISPAEVRGILGLDEFKEGLLHFQKAGIGKPAQKKINENIRGDYVHWIDRHAAVGELKIYLDRLDEMIRFINQDLFLSLKDFEVHLTLYPVGSHYKRHRDQFRGDDHRKLSVILYLNENWKPEEGGQLCLHLQEVTVMVDPEAGRMVCFRSDEVEHEVLPATRERLSITGWALDQFAELKHL